MYVPTKHLTFFHLIPFPSLAPFYILLLKKNKILPSGGCDDAEELYLIWKGKPREEYQLLCVQICALLYVHTYIFLYTTMDKESHHT